MADHRRRFLLFQAIFFNFMGEPPPLNWHPHLFQKFKRNLRTQPVSAEHHFPRHSPDS